MKKKYILLVIISLLASCTGYEPIYNNKGSNIYVKKIEYKDSTNISKQITKKINSLFSINNNLKPISIKLNSNSEEYVLSKDAKGDPVIFEKKIIVEMVVSYNEIDNKYTYVETKSYNNQDNKFELQQYKKNLEKNLIENIFEKIIFNLNQI